MPIEPVDGRLPSEVLGLYLEREAESFAFMTRHGPSVINPGRRIAGSRGGRPEHDARLAAEAEANHEYAARRASDARAEREEAADNAEAEIDRLAANWNNCESAAYAARRRGRALMSNSPKISSSLSPSDGGGPFWAISSLNSCRFFSSTSAMRPSMVSWLMKRVDEHRLLLAQAVGPVDRLVLDGRVPPAVEQEHVVGELQVQPDAAGAVAHQDDVLARVALEAVEDRLALAAAAPCRDTAAGRTAPAPRPASPAARPTARR